MQHRMLVERCNELIGDASNDVRMLARLWQLQNKMGSVASTSAYGTAPRAALNDTNISCYSSWGRMVLGGFVIAESSGFLPVAWSKGRVM